MDEVNTGPLASLRREWEKEKSPKLTLQLAEEHGRQRDFLSAITVLRTGLAHHPRHLAAQVLLGRYLVELEQWPEARETLEKVADVDPTHLIANKLLVETHIATGQTDEARNRLDLYSLLNESDPDIEELERTLAAAGGGEEPHPAEPAPATFEPDTVSPPAEPEPEAVGPPDDSPPVAVSAAAPARPAPRAAEPFGDLFGGGARGRVVERPPAGDIFRLARPAAAPMIEQEPAPSEAQPAIVEPPAEPAISVPEPGAEPSPEAEGGPPATVSLGRLYLQQGHPGEAERAFAAVLEREPDNVAARVGMAAARSGGNWAVNALDLVSRETLAAAGPAERKRAVVAGYLERLRAGGRAAG